MTSGETIRSTSSRVMLHSKSGVTSSVLSEDEESLAQSFVSRRLLESRGTVVDLATFLKQRKRQNNKLLKLSLMT